MDSRRQKLDLSLSHLLSFEVGSSYSSPTPSTLLSDSPGHSLKKGSKNSRSIFSKERFIHANFRFVAKSNHPKEGSIWDYEDPDTPLDWSQIELVIVPISQDITCPICMDKHVAPRLMRCGHVFCWPCILRYADSTNTEKPHGKLINSSQLLEKNYIGQFCSSNTSIESSNSNSFISNVANWRKCPVCFEIVNLKMLKMVNFANNFDYSRAISDHKNPVFIQMKLLVSVIGRGKIHIHDQMDNLSLETLLHQPKDTKKVISNAKTVNQLNVFDKVSWVDESFVRLSIIEPDLQDLLAHLDTLEKNDEDRHHVQAAIAMSIDRQSFLKPEIINPIDKKTNENHVNSHDTASEKKNFARLTKYSNNHESSRIATNDLTETNKKSPKSPVVYFHQSSDGQPYFLCPLNIKILKGQFGSYDRFPTHLVASLLEIETFVMNEELRKRHRYLSHLPIGCHFALCEVDLQNIVSPSVLAQFSTEINRRAINRKTKAMREEREGQIMQLRIRTALGFENDCGFVTIPSAYNVNCVKYEPKMVHNIKNSDSNLESTSDSLSVEFKTLASTKYQDECESFNIDCDSNHGIPIPKVVGKKSIKIDNDNESVGSCGSIASKNRFSNGIKMFSNSPNTSFASIMATSAPQVANLPISVYSIDKDGKNNQLENIISPHSVQVQRASYADYSQRVLPLKMTPFSSEESGPNSLKDENTIGNSIDSMVNFNVSIEDVITASDSLTLKGSFSSLNDPAVKSDSPGKSSHSQIFKKNKKIVIASTQCRRTM